MPFCLFPTLNEWENKIKILCDNGSFPVLIIHTLLSIFFSFCLFSFYISKVKLVFAKRSMKIAHSIVFWDTYTQTHTERVSEWECNKIYNLLVSRRKNSTDFPVSQKYIHANLVSGLEKIARNPLRKWKRQ